MPSFEYFIVARTVLVDKITGDPSILGVLADLHPTRFPALIVSMTALAAWNCGQEEEEKENRGQLIIRRPGQVDPETKDFDFSAKRSSRAHLIRKFMFYRIQHPGSLVLELVLNGEHQATHSIDIYPAEPDAKDSGDLICETDDEQDIRKVDDTAE